MQVRSVLLEKLSGLRQEIQVMANRVDEDLNMAITALRSNDAELAKEVVAGDAVVNAMQLKIEDEAAIVMATQQPVARDLREMVTIFKLTSSLERIGDHAVHLSKTVIKLSDKSSLNSSNISAVRLEKMAEIGREMLRNAITAYLSQDAEAARKTASLDEEIDKENKALLDEILAFMKKRPELIKQAARLFHTSNQLERLGDHITNICENIIYMVEGRHEELNP